MAQSHALVVSIVHRLHFLLCKNVPQADFQRYVLHVAGNGMHFAEQLSLLAHLCGVLKQCCDEASGGDDRLPIGAPLQCFLFCRHMVDIGHVCGVCIRLQVQLRVVALQFVAECQHRRAASVHGARLCQYSCVFASEHLRVVLGHAACYLTVLSGTERGQLSAVAACVVPYLLQTFLYLFTQWCQVAVVLELCVHPLVACIVGQPP